MAKNRKNLSCSFANGKHLKAARALAGLKQSELAALADLHVNSVKRLERTASIPLRDYAAERVGGALAAQGVIATVFPVVMVRLSDSATDDD